MLTDAKLICFAATAKVDAARDFYTLTLGFALVEDSPFALVFDGGGTTLRLQKVPSFTPHAFTALGWEVADIAAAVRHLSAGGVRFERYPGLTADELGIWTSPGGAKVAWFKDPDGNVLSLTALPVADGA
jgi:catechol 2,3-dioxygenase-like lactoylglutathione lyase family enzyme